MNGSISPQIFADRRRFLPALAGAIQNLRESAKICGGIILIALALLSTACDRRRELPPAPGEPVTVVWKHQALRGPPGALEEILADFERANPGVRVVSQDLPGSSDLQHQLHVTALEGGASDLDVLSIDVAWVPEFARAGWVLDLSDRFPPGRVRAEFYPGPAEVVTWGGRTWAVPWFADAGLLYRRTDLLEKHGVAPPETWPELERAARAVLEREGDPALRGYVWQGKQYEGLVCDATEVMRGFGGAILDDRGAIALEAPETVQALRFLRGLIASGVSPPQTTSCDEEASRAIFAAGNAVFHRNWPYAASLFERAGSPVRGKVAFGPPPGGGTLGGWQLAVRAGIPGWKRDAAVALVAHMTSPETQRRVLERFGLNPPRPAVLRDPAVRAAIPWAEALDRGLAAARPRPVTPYYLMISEVLQPELSAAVAGIRTPEEAMRRAAAQVRHILGAGTGSGTGMGTSTSTSTSTGEGEGEGTSTGTGEGGGR